MHWPIDGTTGEIRAGYQRAAELGKWSMKDRVVKADVVSSSEIWLKQKPLELRLRVGRRHWVWRDVDVLNRGSTVRVRVDGDPERI